MITIIMILIDYNDDDNNNDYNDNDNDYNEDDNDNDYNIFQG